MEDTIRLLFNQQVIKLIYSKGKNKQLFTNDQYESLITKVKEAKKKTSKKTPEDYQRLARFDIIKIANTEKLIVPVKNADDPIVFYAYLEQTFQIIHDCHLTLGHAGRSRMMNELRTKYKNVTVDLVTLYLNLCESCRNKKSPLPKKGHVATGKGINSKCQIDLINMHGQADGDYKFILCYHDYLTKFVQLRALKTGSAKEVAFHLVDIFSIFGAPCILQSNQGKDFANKIVDEVFVMWPELKIVSVNSRRSEASQDLQDIEKMVRSWVESNNSTEWSTGLRFIQLMRNKEYHSGIKCSPYEAMFGCKARVGSDSLDGLYKEVDLTVELN